MNPVYTRLSGVKLFSRSYTFKFLAIAFLGIHIPLIGLIIFILAKPNALQPLSVFLLTLLLTLGATAVTLLTLNALLEPLKASKNALENYLDKRELPGLPVQFQDEAGVLMNKVQETVTSLDSLLEEKKDLIALLSHDLRTPLSAIMLLSKTLEQTPDLTPEECQSIGGLITKSAKEQMELFQRILEILRSDDLNRMHLQIQKVSVQDVIGKSLDSLETLAAQKNIDITIVGETDLHIMADVDMLSQVVKNLLSNAIKFSHPGSSIKIKIEQHQGKASIAVIDNGLGFNPSDSEKLFQRFTDKRKAGTNNEVSTGMGLYLSSKIIKAHQGLLTAFSDGTNKGSTFVIEV